HFNSRWRRNRTPQDKPSVLETERAPRRIHHLYSPTSPVPRAGVEPDLSGLKDRRPHRKSNGAFLRQFLPISDPKKRTGWGSLLPPAGAVAIRMAARGYPLVSRSSSSSALSFVAVFIVFVSFAVPKTRPLSSQPIYRAAR